MNSDDVEPVAAFVEGARWRFASTMTDNPHWYILERDYAGAEFGALCDRIDRSGQVGRFRGHDYRYLILGDGFFYWVMPSIGNKAGRVINRKPVAQADWD